MKPILNKKNGTLNIGMIIMSVFFLGIFIHSCDKDNFEITDNDSPKSVPDVINTNVDFSSKITNPYDFIGKYHNEGLQFVIDEHRKSPKLKAGQELDEQIKELVVSYMKKNDVFKSTGMKPSINFSSISVLNEINLKQVKLKSDNLFPIKDQQIYYEKLKKVFSKKNVSSPQALISYINEIECNIINDKKLKEEEIAQLLITTSVAKYSSIFWIEALLKADNKRSGIRLKNGSEPGWNFSDWWQDTFVPSAQEVVEADFDGAAAGAIIGVLVGAGAGSVAPGAGTVTVGVTGAIVGGAQGAIGSSAYKGFKIVFW